MSNLRHPTVPHDRVVPPKERHHPVMHPALERPVVVGRDLAEATSLLVGLVGRYAAEEYAACQNHRCKRCAYELLQGNSISVDNVGTFEASPVPPTLHYVGHPKIKS